PCAAFAVCFADSPRVSGCVPLLPTSGAPAPIGRRCARSCGRRSLPFRSPAGKRWIRAGGGATDPCWRRAGARASEEAPVRATDTLDFPDGPLLPAQLPVALDGVAVTGVKGLMIAVLEDAISCLGLAGRGAGARARLQAVAAAKWIRSRDASWPFSFQAI